MHDAGAVFRPHGSNDRAGLGADLLQLLGDQKAIPLIGKDGELAEEWA